MFENKTMLDKETMGFLAGLSIKSPRINLFRIIFGIVGLGFIGIAYRNMGEPKGYCFITLALVCIVFAVWGLGAMLKRRIMNAANLDEGRVYTIEEDGIVMALPVADGAAWNKLDYPKFSHVVEGKNQIALKLVNSDAYLVMDKNGFTKGTAQEALAFFASKGLEIKKA